MILGIGSDISDVRRIAKVIERHGDRFIDRIFTPHERARAERRRNRIETYAKRFAAKEACAKALGTGIRAGVWWRDMGVINLASGRPTMALTGGAKRRLQEPARRRDEFFIAAIQGAQPAPMATAEMITKACAIGPSSVMVRSMRASKPLGVIASRRRLAPPVSSMVGRPDGRLTTPMSRHHTPARSPVPSALAQASLAAKRLA